MGVTYRLSEQEEAFVEAQVANGRFASADDVVREGLRLVQLQDSEREAELEWLREQVRIGAESGPGIPADEVFAGLEKLIDDIEAGRA